MMLCVSCARHSLQLLLFRADDHSILLAQASGGSNRRNQLVHRRAAITATCRVAPAIESEGASQSQPLAGLASPLRVACCTSWYEYRYELCPLR